MSGNVAFYDPYVSGHHVEYLYHLAAWRRREGGDGRLYFIVREAFDRSFDELMPLDELSRIGVRIIHLEEVLGSSSSTFEQTVTSYRRQIGAIKRIARAHDIEHCVFMYMDNPLQVALSTPMARRPGFGLSGILLNPFGGFGGRYKKYYYSGRRVLQNYLMMSNRNIRSVFVIIDEATARRLNRMHLTRKFVFVSDPVLRTRELFGLPEEAEERDDRLRFLLFGSLNRRKGIFMALEMCDRLSDEELARVRVDFVGTVAGPDRAAFRERVRRIQTRDDRAVQVTDRRVPYRALPAHFGSTDFVLLPYEATQASSGVLGIAADYGKPVICQGGGVFERHIDEYELGAAIQEMDASRLTGYVKKLIAKEEVLTCSARGCRDYLQGRDGDFFSGRIMSRLY